MRGLEFRVPTRGSTPATNSRLLQITLAVRCAPASIFAASLATFFAACFSSSAFAAASTAPLFSVPQLFRLPSPPSRPASRSSLDFGCRLLLLCGGGLGYSSLLCLLRSLLCLLRSLAVSRLLRFEGHIGLGLSRRVLAFCARQAQAQHQRLLQVQAHTIHNTMREFVREMRNFSAESDLRSVGICSTPA